MISKLRHHFGHETLDNILRSSTQTHQYSSALLPDLVYTSELDSWSCSLSSTDSSHDDGSIIPLGHRDNEFGEISFPAMNGKKRKRAVSTPKVIYIEPRSNEQR